MVSSRGFWGRLALPYPSRLQLFPVWLRRFQAIWVASGSVRGLERRDPPFFRRDQGLGVTQIPWDCHLSAATRVRRRPTSPESKRSGALEPAANTHSAWAFVR